MLYPTKSQNIVFMLYTKYVELQHLRPSFLPIFHGAMIHWGSSCRWSWTWCYGLCNCWKPSLWLEEKKGTKKWPSQLSGRLQISRFEVPGSHIIRDRISMNIHHRFRIVDIDDFEDDKTLCHWNDGVQEWELIPEWPEICRMPIHLDMT